MHLSVGEPPEEVEGETLAQRIKRLKEQGGTGTGLPAARPVSGDFASEMMSQFGGELLKDDKGKGKEIETAPANEEEETLGQRRKRLQAEREAREKEVGAGGEALQEGLVVNKRRSMADILSAHPAAGAGRAASFTKLTNRPATGLLGLHEKQSQQRASTMTNFVTQQTINARHGRVKSAWHEQTPSARKL
ncbi:5-methylthioadenosine s-adenosylhomocysteine protein [Rutstroemia sp. NJR-2017a BBW]|nr:5-methylthioadenosine s-adenosylhomocysteine protein [Rutstroemia sp. NJR-2017a BBW]